VLEVRGLGKVFHPGTAAERVALRGIDLAVAPGDFAVVIGDNGAGKSTLLNAVAGDFAVETGAVLIDGRDVTGLPAHRRARWVARVFQDPALGAAGAMSIEENLAVAARRGCRRRFRAALGREGRARDRTLLARFGLGLEERLRTRVDLLSGGQRQALALAMAVVRRPDVLLLDEHTAALDPRTAGLVMDATVAVVGDAGLTTLMVTHNMQHAIRFGNRLLMMRQGRIALDVSGPAKAALTVEGLIERFHLADDKLLLQA